jgi:hypothetical protein
MSEKMIRVKLSELATIRIVCKKATCGGISEVPIAEVERLIGGKCRHCEQSLRVGNEDALASLAEAIKNLTAIKNKVEVEFEIPAS